MRLLVTRPEPDAARTAGKLRALGHQAVVAPLMRVETVAADFSEPFDAVVMTSANAARAAMAQPHAGELTRLPCFTVGDRSAEAARAAGFADVMSADGALADLVALVAVHCPKDAHLLYLAGEDRAGDLAGELGARGFMVKTGVVYRAVAAGSLPTVAFAQVDGVLHYSRRSAATLLRLAGEAGALNDVLSIAHYCFSEEIAEPLRRQGAKRIEVAESPLESALFALLTA